MKNKVLSLMVREQICEVFYATAETNIQELKLTKKIEVHMGFEENLLKFKRECEISQNSWSQLVLMLWRNILIFMRNK